METQKRSLASSAKFLDGASLATYENETSESQLKKLIFENTTLQMENKLIKDKYNRSVARITELETKLKDANVELNDLRVMFDGEKNRQMFTANAEMERQIEQYKSKSVSDSKEIDVLKSEMVYLEQQVSSAKKEADSLRTSIISNKAHEAHKLEIGAFQDEINHLKQLLKESENGLLQESNKSQELFSQVQKFSQIRDALQLQIDEGSSGGTSAEKQVASLQVRLKITEERLSQERDDRSGNLSQIEEKLLSDNAKLQGKEKELERQLKREKEKTRSLEQRMQNFREENLQLKLAMPDDEIQEYDIPQGQHSKSRQEYKKPAYDVVQIRKQLETESGIQNIEANKDRIFLYLWEDRHKALHSMKEWMLYLKQLELPEGNNFTENLKNALALKEEYESKMQHNEENMETIRAEKITADQIYKQQLADLVKERHEAFAKLQTLEDLMEALRAENDVLRQGLAKTSGTLETRQDVLKTKEIEALEGEITSLQSRLIQATRKNKAAEIEISTLRTQLQSRDKELSETARLLQDSKTQPTTNVGENEMKQKRIEALIQQISDLKDEIRKLTDRNATLLNEKHRVEADNDSIRYQLRTAQKEVIEQSSSLNTSQNETMKQLEEEINGKDTQIITLTSELNENKFMMQQAREESANQKRMQFDLEQQIQSIQEQLDQRCQVLDSLAERENDQMEQLVMVKGMMDTFSVGLTQKQGEIDVLTIKLQQAQEQISKLEKQKMEISHSSSTDQHGTPVTTHSYAANEIRISELEMEKDNLNTQILDAMGSTASLQEEQTKLNKELSEAREEIVMAQTASVQATNQTNVLERRLHTLREEGQLVSKEKDECKSDLSKAESSLAEVIEKFEMESRRKHDDFKTQYEDDSPEGKKLIEELQSLRVLTFAREKEGTIITNKFRRQEEEKRNCDLRVELLQRENEQTRNDVGRITKELVLKMKESAANVELNKTLTNDQATLQKSVVAMEKQLQKEKEKTQKRKTEITDIIKKMDDSEKAQISSAQTMQQKDAIIANLELKLSQASRDLSQMEMERDGLRTKTEHLSEDVRNLSNVSTALESKIQEKEHMVEEERSQTRQHNDKLTSVSQKLEVLKHEQNLLLGNLTSERNIQEKLREEIKELEQREAQGKAKMAEMVKEMDMARGQLVAANEGAKQVKDQKDIILKDYHDACRRLGEKESQLHDIRKQSDEEMIQVRHQTLLQSQAVQQERTNSERDVKQLRSEIENLQEEILRQNCQVALLDQTKQDLDDVKRRESDLQKHIDEQNRISADSKLLIESLRAELLAASEEKSKLQDTIARKEVSILDLRDQLRSSGETTESQVTEMRHTIDGMRSHHEYEKKTLREALNKVEDNLKASVQEVRTLMETRDQLTEQNRVHERSISDINYQLSHEVSARKLVEEKLEQALSTLDEMRKKKVSADEKADSSNSTLRKLETEHNLMKDRYKTMSGKLKDMELALNVSESAIRTGDEKIEALKTELHRQQQMMESLKQQSSSKLRKMNLDLKQQIEINEKDSVKVNQQCIQLTGELELAREQLATKSRDNLKLQEKSLELEEELKEIKIRLKQSQDSLKQEEQMQTQLNYRFEEQESELKKLRTFLSKKADEDGDGRSMWQEMNRVISELSRQLTFHMETSKFMEHGGRDDGQLVRKLQRSLLETEAQLNTERTLHHVTRSSMQALEEDCNRLRQSLYSMRRRGTKPEKKSKSRMEEINEIIARSQTRAQALMASGEFTLDSTAFDYNGGDANFSPNASLTSDTSFSSANMANLSFLNLSGTYPYLPKK